MQLVIGRVGIEYRPFEGQICFFPLHHVGFGAHVSLCSLLSFSPLLPLIPYGCATRSPLHKTVPDLTIFVSLLVGLCLEVSDSCKREYNSATLWIKEGTK